MIPFLIASFSDANTLVQEDLYSLYGDEEMVSIATGTPQPVINAPAMTSVITSKDIENIGARELHDLLTTIPGLHVSNSGISANSTYVVRGNYSKFNQRVLVLIDGVPISDLYFNNRGLSWGGMPVRFIERVEVVRGPGSAIYGADAYVGVINVITKNFNSVENRVGLSLGNYHTQDAWLSGKAEFGALKNTFSLQVSKTEGSSGTLKYDAATTPTNNISLAPGEINRQRDVIDANWRIGYNNLVAHLMYQGRFNVGTGGGHAGALDPEGEQNTYSFLAELKHTLHSPDNDWEIETKLSSRQISEDIKLKLFPNGYLDLFPQGMIGEPSYREKHHRFTVTGLYESIANHKLRAGVGVNYGRLYDIKENKNFDSNGSPLPELVDATNDLNLIFIRPHSRKLGFIFLQDEWKFAPDWILTAGLRYDRYSDFGDTLNQRLALVWQVDYNVTVKLLYGSAFRPPSFADFHLINNPAVNGNPELDPETVNTTELVFVYRPTSETRLTFNMFYSEMEDLIENSSGSGTVGLITENIGKQKAVGFESELKWTPNPEVNVISHYSFQDTKDDIADDDAGLAPKNLFYVRADIHRGQWSFSGQLNWVGKSKRAPGDNRDAIDDYATVDFNLGYDYSQHWDFSLLIKNLFNEDVRDPGLTNADDIPGPRRLVQFSATYYY